MSDELMRKYTGKAKRLSEFLKSVGAPIGLNNAQHAVAIVEGYKSWQEMRASMEKNLKAGELSPMLPAPSTRLPADEEIIYNNPLPRIRTLFGSNSRSTIIGGSGTGKTGLIHEYFGSLPKPTGLIICEAGDYRELCAKLGGTYIEVDVNKNHSLFDFDIRNCALTDTAKEILIELFKVLSYAQGPEAQRILGLEVSRFLMENTDSSLGTKLVDLVNRLSMYDKCGAVMASNLTAWLPIGRFSNLINFSRASLKFDFANQLYVIDIRKLYSFSGSDGSPRDQFLAAILANAALHMMAGVAHFPIAVDLGRITIGKSGVSNERILQHLLQMAKHSRCPILTAFSNESLEDMLVRRGDYFEQFVFLRQTGEKDLLAIKSHFNTTDDQFNALKNVVSIRGVRTDFVRIGDYTRDGAIGTSFASGSIPQTATTLQHLESM